MKYSLITFRSVTPAQHAESYLRKEGIQCMIRRTPKWMEAQGCGYSLKISVNEALRCVELLRTKGIAFRKIYLVRDNGLAEEMAL